MTTGSYIGWMRELLELIGKWLVLIWMDLTHRYTLGEGGPED